MKDEYQGKVWWSAEVTRIHPVSVLDVQPVKKRSDDGWKIRDLPLNVGVVKVPNWGCGDWV